MSVFLRSAFIVLATMLFFLAASQIVGLSTVQSLLAALPVGFFTASFVTFYYLAKAGSQGNKTRQLFILLTIELILVPIGSAAAIVAYFLEPK